MPARTCDQTFLNLPSAMKPQRLDDTFWQGNRASRSARFRLDGSKLARLTETLPTNSFERLSDAESARIEINIALSQTQRLSLAKP